MKNHPTCGTCGHWEKQDPDKYRVIPIPRKFGICQYAQITPKQRRIDAPIPKGVRMFVADAEKYHAELQTRGDFYCPHHSDLAQPFRG